MGQTEEPILLGTEVTEAGSGVVRMLDPTNGWTFGSGNLLKNDWVLTAAHCVNVDRDWAFGNSGIWTGTSAGDAATAVKVAGLNTLWYVGSAPGGGANRFLMVGRLTGAPAVPDPAFDGDGRKTFNIAESTSEVFNDFVVQTDGKLVAVGYATVGGSKRMLVVRMHPNGILDNTFDNDGVAVTDFASMDNEVANSVVFDHTTGNIIVGGSASDSSHTEFALARYTPAGALDSTFDGDGKVLTNMGASNTVSIGQIVRQTDGKIVAVGTGSNPGTGWAALARYNLNGSLDAGFGTGGTRTIGPNATGRTVLFHTTTDKLYVGGSIEGDPTVWRLTSSGSIDTAFGTAGAVKPTFFAGESGSVVELLTVGGVNPIRAVVNLGLSGTGNPRAVGIASFSPAGIMSSDRVFPEHTGAAHGLPGNTSPVAAALQGSRVVVIGTQAPGANGRAQILSVYPDRTSYTATANAPYANVVRMGNETRNVSAIYLPSSKLDVALVKLSSGMTMGNPGSTTGYNFPGFSAKNGNHVPFDVQCTGYGNSVLLPDSPDDEDQDPQQSGSQDLRTGQSRITGYSNDYAILGYVPGATTQLPLRGDSGSACFDPSDGNKLVEVFSRGSHLNGFGIPASKFSGWATTTMQNN